MLTVTVPDGVGVGGQFQANTLSGPMLVTVPPGVRPGDTLQINTAAPATGLTCVCVYQLFVRSFDADATGRQGDPHQRPQVWGGVREHA